MLALLAGAVTGYAAASVLVAGTVHGVVVPKLSPELEEKGFSVEGFTIDLGKVEAGSTVTKKAEFKLTAPHEAKLVVRVEAKGPIAWYKITIKTPSGEEVALQSWWPKAEIKVPAGTSVFEVAITMGFKKDVIKEEAFELTILLEPATA